MTYLYSHCKVCAWIIACAMIGAVVLPVLSLGADFGWSDQFEGDPRGASPTNTEWDATSADVIVTNLAAADSWGADPYDPVGTNLVYIPQDASLTNTLTDSTSATNVWVDMYIQPNLYDGAWSNREVDATAAALFFFDGASSNVVVHDGSSLTNWVKVAKSVGGTDVEVSPVGQTRVTVYMDYVNDNWSLFLNGRLMKTEIGFVSSKSAMGNLVISDDVYVDNVWISTTNYPDANVNGQPALQTADGRECDEDRDGMGDAWEILHFGAIDVSEGGSSENQDGDSRSDLEEYVDGSDPTNPESVSWLIPYYEKFVTAGADGSDMPSTFRAISTLASNVTVSSGENYSLQTMSDSKAIALAGGGAMSVVVSNQAGTNVFCQAYVRATPCEVVPDGVVDSEAAAICVVGDVLYAYSSNAWVSTGVTNAALTNGWVGLAAHLDYNAAIWDLYYTLGGDLSMQMTKVDAGPFDFNTNCSSTTFTEMIITNESSVTSYVDAVAVSLTDKAVLGSYTNLVIFERLQNTINETDLPPYDYSADGTLETGPLGTDIAFGLAPGDVIQAYTGGVWIVYELLDSGLWDRKSGTANLDWSELPGIEIVREPGYDSLAFYPFGESDTPDNVETQTVYASADGSFHGRSRLRVPSSRLICIDVNDLEFDPAPADDDELIFYVPATESQLIFTWDVPSQKWLNSNVTTFDVCPGDGFSYFRRTDSELKFIIAQ